MKIPDFIPIKNEGTLLILSTSPPYYIGKVVSFKNEIELKDWKSKTSVNRERCICGQVEGYSILVVFNGSLDRQNKALPESAYIFKQMANWYLEQKINGKNRYNKY